MPWNIHKTTDGRYVRTVSCPADEVTHHLASDERAEWADAAPAPAVTPVTYAERRAVAYRPTGAQLDDILKALAHLDAGGVDIGDAGRAAIEAHQDVKTRFPKETET